MEGKIFYLQPISQMLIIQMGKSSKTDGVCRLLTDPENQGSLSKESNNPSEIILTIKWNKTG